MAGKIPSWQLWVYPLPQVQKYHLKAKPNGLMAQSLYWYPYYGTYHALTANACLQPSTTGVRWFPRPPPIPGKRSKRWCENSRYNQCKQPNNEMSWLNVIWDLWFWPQLHVDFVVSSSSIKMHHTLERVLKIVWLLWIIEAAFVLCQTVAPFCPVSFVLTGLAPGLSVSGEDLSKHLLPERLLGCSCLESSTNCVNCLWTVVSPTDSFLGWFFDIGGHEFSGAKLRGKNWV